MVVLIRVIFPSFLTSLFRTIARPLWGSENFISIKLNHIGSYFSFKESLIDENTLLKMQINSQENKLASFGALQKENADLLNAIGRMSTNNGIISFVLSRPPQSPYDSMIIDVGNSAMISNGDRVVVDGSIWLGNISDVFGNTSGVTLLSSPKEKLDLVIARTKTPITLSGFGAGNFQGQLPRGIDIVEGDVIVPAGLSPFVVARVSAVELNPEDSFQKIYASVPLNINEIQSVSVLRGDTLKIDEKLVDTQKKSTTTPTKSKIPVKKP